MRYLYLILFLSLPFFTNAQIVREGDISTGTLECSLEKPVSIDSETPELNGMYQPVYMSDIWGINLYLASDFEHPFSEEVLLVYFQVDHEQSEAMMYFRDSWRRHGQQISSWFIMLKEDDFRKIANADNVQFKVGTAFFEVSKDRRRYMSDIIDMVAMN